MKSETWETRMQVTPYEGEEDYIFISYSHRDMEQVLPILRHLQENGVRFWYDEGIDPGSEWPEAIARHLNGCRGCLAFMSPSSLLSPNCRREVNFALSKNKDFLSVMLSPVEMSLGMEMQISSYQSLIKYKYPNEEQFLEKLLTVELIASCRSAQPDGPMADDSAQSETAGRSDEGISEKSSGPEREKAGDTAAAARNNGQSAPPADTPEGSKPGLSRKTLGIGGGVLAALLVLVIVLTLSGRSSKTGTTDTPPEPDISAPDISEDIPPSAQPAVLYNTLMSDSIDDTAVAFEDIRGCSVFGSEYTRDQISSVTFLDTLDGLPDDAWDVSGAGDGSVMAWVEPDGSLFDLYIGAEKGVAAPDDSAYLFAGYESAKSINFNGMFDTANATNMWGLFVNCVSLESIDVSSLDTANVEYMGSMFYNCSGLKSLDLSGLDTSSNTTTYCMFELCSSLESLDLSSFDTSNVTDMSYMFYDCGSLKLLDVSSFDTSNVTYVDSMFEYCGSLESLDLSGFNTSGVLYMNYMFAECGSLKSLDLSSFNTAGVIDMYGMFAECGSLESLDLSGFDTSGVKNMVAMFHECRSLKSLDLSGFNTASVTNMDSMFYNCSGLESLDLSGFDTSNVAYMSGMFTGCSSLRALDVSGFDTANVADMDSMFYDCGSLESLDLSSFNTANVTNMRVMFSGCGRLKSLDLTGFDITGVTDMSYMFYGCTDLTELHVTNWNTSGINTEGMFDYCYISPGIVSSILSGSEVST